MWENAYSLKQMRKISRFCELTKNASLMSSGSSIKVKHDKIRGPQDLLVA